MDGWLTVLRPGADPEQLLEIVDVPITLAGLSRFNVENALAAASAALAAGLDRGQVIEGLGSFLPDTEHNPGRMNVFTLDGYSVVIDLAHNEAGLEALLEVMRGIVAREGRTMLALGAVGDRTDELVTNLGEIAAKGADVVVVGHKRRYLRGRSTDDLDAWESSLDAVAAWAPRSLGLTHSGEIEDPEPHLELVRRRLREQADLAGRTDSDEFARHVEREARQRAGESAEALMQAVPPEQQWAGLDRWRRKREQS